MARLSINPCEMSMFKPLISLVTAVLATFLVEPPTLRAAIVTDGGFETPAIPHGTYVYNPTGSAWNFVGFSGIIHENTDWPAPPAIDGSQIAFLQVMTNPSASSISQDLMLPSIAPYTLTYYSAGRSRPGHPGDVGFDFLLDNVKIGSGSTDSGQPFTKHSFGFFVSQPRIANLRIVATSFAGIDSTAFFDKIEITILPEPSAIALASLCVCSFASKRVRRLISRKGQPSKSPLCSVDS
jgi:hypothetical protein